MEAFAYDAGWRGHRLVLTSESGADWAAEAGDVFECLMMLREQVEPEGIRLCCNGSRLDAWASGMQRDMGSGFSTYLLAGVSKGQRPPTANTLDFAPPEMIAKVTEQRAWYKAWLGDPGS